jgi:hypothetical protein
MWCVPKLTPTFIARMFDLLELFQRPYNSKEPVVCVDEKTTQLLGHLRDPIPPSPGKYQRIDYHYKRNGVRNIFVGVEPKGGRHFTSNQAHKTHVEYAAFIAELVTVQYPDAERIHIVRDNYSTHSLKNLISALPDPSILSRVTFHPTPVHGSWLNPAEIEIGILERQCLNRRIENGAKLDREVHAWTIERDERRVKINWKFTKEKAKKVFKINDSNMQN